MEDLKQRIEDAYNIIDNAKGVLTVFDKPLSGKQIMEVKGLIIELVERERKYREALEWYNDESINNHNYHSVMGTDLTFKAKQALSGEVEKRIVTINEICGYLAMWVFRQHPYHSVEHVDSAGAKLRVAAATEGFTPKELPMKEFNSQLQIEDFLRIVLYNSPETLAWNSRRNGNKSEFSFLSRYDAPAPEDDFIDIDALFRNVATSVWVNADEIPK